MVLAAKRIAKMGKNNPLTTIQFLEMFMAFMWEKKTQQKPHKSWVSSPTRCSTQKWFVLASNEDKQH